MGTQTYPAGRLVSDCTKTDGWRFEHDACAEVESGGLRLLPPEPIFADTFHSQVQSGPKVNIKHGNAVLPLANLTGCAARLWNCSWPILTRIGTRA